MDKIICLGKNYADHALEMKEGSPSKPLLFIKPPSSLVEIKNQSIVDLPWHRGPIHFECEVVLKLYKKNIIALALGIDLTLRDTQKILKTNGHPWEIAKVFKNSAVITPFKGLKDFGDWKSEEFELKVNGVTRQKSCINNAILNPDEMIHHANDHFVLCDGDLIFTGTPSGVGEIKPGDEVLMSFGPIQNSFKFGAFHG